MQSHAVQLLPIAADKVLPRPFVSGRASARQRQFFRLCQYHFMPRVCRGRLSALAKNALDARVSVKQVGGGVALQGEHPVPTENVIALPVLRKIGIFDCAKADDPGDLAAPGNVQFRVLVRHDLERSWSAERVCFDRCHRRKMAKSCLKCSCCGAPVT